jgi:hypothetical protein
VSIDNNKKEETRSGADRRRSRRLVLTVPVTLEWTSSQGELIKDQATARDVSIHGARLFFADGRRCPAVEKEITLKSSFSGETTIARVARVRRLASGKVDSLAVDIISPTPTFWGLTFQLQQTMAQLLEIEIACQAGMKDVDFRVMKSLGEAVEQIRQVASIVQEWQELMVARKNAYSVLDALSSARIKKTTQLLLEITTDFDSNELSPYAEDFAHFAQAIERISLRMKNGPTVFRDA